MRRGGRAWRPRCLEVEHPSAASLVKVSLAAGELNFVVFGRARSAEGGTPRLASCSVSASAFSYVPQADKRSKLPPESQLLRMRMSFAWTVCVTRPTCDCQKNFYSVNKQGQDIIEAPSSSRLNKGSKNLGNLSVFCTSSTSNQMFVWV